MVARELYVKYSSTVWAFVSLAFMMITSITVLSIFKADVNPLVAFIGSSIMPCVLLLINQAKTDEVKKEVTDLKSVVTEQDEHKKEEGTA